MEFASDLSARKPVFRKGTLQPRHHTGMPSSTQVSVARDGGPFSCRPQRVNDRDLPPILPSVGSSATHDAWVDISLSSVGWNGGRGRVVRGALTPVSCVMPGCRAPMRPKSKQCFGAVSYTERSIEMKRAVTKGMVTKNQAVYFWAR